MRSLKLETSTMDILIPIKKELTVEPTISSNNINLKKDRSSYSNKRISKFEKLLRKEIDKLK